MPVATTVANPALDAGIGKAAAHNAPRDRLAAVRTTVLAAVYAAHVRRVGAARHHHHRLLLLGDDTSTASPPPVGEGGPAATLAGDVATEIAAIRVALRPKAANGPRRRTDDEMQLDALSLIERAHHELLGVRAAVAARELSEVAARVADAKALVEELRPYVQSDHCPADIYAVLKREALTEKAALKHRFDELAAVVFQFSNKEPGVSELTVSFRVLATPSTKYHDAPVHLRDLLHSLYNAGHLSEVMGRLARAAADAFLLPMTARPDALLECPDVVRARLHAVVRFGALRPSFANHVAELGNAASSRLHKRDIPRSLSHVLSFSRFLVGTLFGDSPQPGSDLPEPERAIFARAYAPVLLDVVLGRLLAPAVPSDPEEWTAFAGTAGAIVEFDRAMKVCGALPFDLTDLLDFVDQAPSLYARRRRATILARVRDIVQSEDHNTEPVDEATQRGGRAALNPAFSKADGSTGKTGKGNTGKTAESVLSHVGIRGMDLPDLSQSPLALPPCRVSTRVAAVVDLVYDVMRQANSAAESGDINTYRELLFCSRDALDLFRALAAPADGVAAPASAAPSLSFPPPVGAAVFLSDCLYVAHHLATLGWQHRPRQTAETAKDPCLHTFADMIPAFREDGEKCFRAQLRHQQEILLGHLADAGDLLRLSNDDELERAERAFKRAATHLAALCRAWKPILPRSLYLGAAGLLLDEVLTDVLDRAAAARRGVATSTGAATRHDTSHQLRHLLSVFAPLRSCLSDSARADTLLRPAAAAVNEPSDAAVTRHARAWQRFRDAIVALEVGSA
ncbi:Centromere/kinetochore protein zw10 [Cladochytrium tenue]|nr:Centromere/kinetochore protein zw10 [Cladochytrium tenue]